MHNSYIISKYSEECQEMYDEIFWCDKNINEIPEEFQTQEMWNEYFENVSFYINNENKLICNPYPINLIPKEFITKRMLEVNSGTKKISEINFHKNEKTKQFWIDHFNKNFDISEIPKDFITNEMVEYYKNN